MRTFLKKKVVKRSLWTLGVLFVLLNVMCFFHAYKLTHFNDASVVKTKRAERLSASEKIKAAFFGVNNPKPTNRSKPNSNFNTIYIQSNVKLECWDIPVAQPKGTVAFFHGFGGSKSSMIEAAEAFNEMGYSALLVDFMGSGGSEGSQTTIGYEEAKNVTDVFNYLQKRGDKNIMLYGCSMGSAAIMKAVAEKNVQPTKIMLECPFATMSEAVGVRLTSMKVPQYPFRPLLMFWGGVQNGFNAFSHNPKDYAMQIDVPTLMMYGKRDIRVTLEETERIYNNLPAKKQLAIFENGGHGRYIDRCKEEWIRDIRAFLK